MNEAPTFNAQQSRFANRKDEVLGDIIANLHDIHAALKALENKIEALDELTPPAPSQLNWRGLWPLAGNKGGG